MPALLLWDHTIRASCTRSLRSLVSWASADGFTAGKSQRTDQFYVIQVSYTLKDKGYPAFSSALSEVGRGGLGKAYWF